LNYTGTEQVSLVPLEAFKGKCESENLSVVLKVIRGGGKNTHGLSPILLSLFHTHAHARAVQI